MSLNNYRSKSVGKLSQKSINVSTKGPSLGASSKSKLVEKEEAML
jgi:hypothetical protein